MRIFLCAALAASIACVAAEPVPEAPRAPQASRPTQLSELPMDEVLVERGDVKITVGDYLAALEKLPEQDRYPYRADIDKMNSLLSALFVTRSIAAEARKAGMEKDPLIQLRMELSKETVLSQAYMANFEKTIVPPDFEDRAREIYQASPERYQRPARYKLRRVLAPFQGRTEEDARRWAQAAFDKLKAGELPGRVVHQYSMDPVALRNDGIVEGADKSFEPEVLASLKDAPLNQPIGPIRTGYAYEVVILMERIPPETIPFELAKKGIIAAEQEKFRKSAIDEKLGSITNSKDVKIYTDRLEPLKLSIDRDLIHKMHVEKARQSAEEKARRQQEAAKGSGG